MDDGRGEEHRRRHDVVLVGNHPNDQPAAAHDLSWSSTTPTRRSRSPTAPSLADWPGRAERPSVGMSAFHQRDPATALEAMTEWGRKSHSHREGWGSREGSTPARYRSSGAGSWAPAASSGNPLGAGFEDCLAIVPCDGPSKVFLENASLSYAPPPPSAEWNGVWSLVEK
jgi:hypothetical protein